MCGGGRDANRVGTSHMGLAGEDFILLAPQLSGVRCPLHIVISKTHHYRYTARTKHRWSLDSSTRKDFRSWRASDKSYQHFELRFVFKITFCFSVLLLKNWIKFRLFHRMSDVVQCISFAKECLFFMYLDVIQCHPTFGEIYRNTLIYIWP